MTVKNAPILGQKIQGINGDVSFLETFSFNPQVVREIYKFFLDDNV